MIPKVIHYCWFGGTDLPEKDKACVESWRRFCPGWEIVRWDESNYDVRKNPYMAQAYDARRWCFVPDFGRLDIVFEHGGVYLDTDVELNCPLDDLLVHEGYAGFARDGFVSPGLGFAAGAHNPVIGHMMRVYDELEFSRPDGTLNLTASPHYASASLEELGFTMNDELQVIDGFALLPHDWLDPLDEGAGKVRSTADTHSIHRYFGSWLDPQVKMQKELRRELNSRNVPDAIAFPLSCGIAYAKHHGLLDSVKRVVRGPEPNGGGES